jgi:hypothetical protein
LLAVPAAIVIGMLFNAGAAAAATTTTVGTTPASFTPWLLKSTPSQYVRELVPCGNLMYAVGTISAIGQGSHTYTRSNAFSFSATTGVLTSWAPRVNAQVNSIAFSPNCATAYLGGSFTQINGTAAKDIAAVSTSSGALITTFSHTANAEVDTVQYAHGAVLAGGVFTSIAGVARTRFASLSPTTGKTTTYANLAIEGGYRNATMRIYNSQLSHSGTKLLVEGVFTSIAGASRQQVAVLDLGASSVTLDRWYAPEFNSACGPGWPFYAHAANWSPDDATIYVATAGRNPQGTSGPGGLCDAVSSFSAASTTQTHRWINYTGCDSLFAVVADADNVYITGHERWANNPHGCDSAGPGALARPGLGDINPTTGQATSWNPTRSLGVGGDDLTLTSAGLWVASDNFSTGAEQYCGHQTNHGGICFLPY